MNAAARTISRSCLYGWIRIPRDGFRGCAERRAKIQVRMVLEEIEMPKLSLMFENKIMKEVSVGTRPVTIGRSPDNDLPVDNLAVSNHHAKVYFEAGRMVVEDLDSLNGTFVNDLRVERATLHDGDSIWVGKHHI